MKKAGLIVMFLLLLVLSFIGQQATGINFPVIYLGVVFAVVIMYVGSQFPALIVLLVVLVIGFSLAYVIGQFSASWQATYDAQKEITTKSIETRNQGQLVFGPDMIQATAVMLFAIGAGILVSYFVNIHQNWLLFITTLGAVWYLDGIKFYLVAAGIMYFLTVLLPYILGKFGDIIAEVIGSLTGCGCLVGAVIIVITAFVTLIASSGPVAAVYYLRPLTGAEWLSILGGIIAGFPVMARLTPYM